MKKNALEKQWHFFPTTTVSLVTQKKSGFKHHTWFNIVAHPTTTAGVGKGSKERSDSLAIVSAAQGCAIYISSSRLRHKMRNYAAQLMAPSRSTVHQVLGRKQRIAQNC
jgi:hypothetical protein